MSASPNIHDTLWQLAFHIKVQCKRAVQEFGVKLGGMHVRALLLIQAQPQQCTANHLCAVSGRDKAQITRIVKDLEDQQLIERRPNPNDGRSQILLLTTDGRALLKKIRSAEQEVEAQYVQGLSPQEREAFIAIGQKMLGNLKPAATRRQ
ncbi:MarR family transcriptional regulator [uncultured Gilvimarinus sp.]|uniref:MarR family winged helix-turn-helix transcriptional regulator n=1 Tax=uncultured Gilvimarinus sp. TaxID=1689143 RepID=UPI0030ECAB44|tara:strand:+ start:1502 stop:1951 length:450 start_codon:yes stop_codon:yes gene_type:complete